MTVTAEQRYRLPESGSGTGHDLVLDVPVGVARLAAAAPARLARQLRASSPTPWWRVLDAVVDGDSVVVVLPAPASVLSDQLRQGVSAHVAQALVAGLEPTLTELTAMGLRPASLDPERIWATAEGQLLLQPVVGPPPGPDEVTALTAALGSTPCSGAAVAVRPARGPVDAPTAADPPTAPLRLAGPAPRAVGASAAGSDRPPSSVADASPSALATPPAPTRLPRPDLRRAADRSGPGPAAPTGRGRGRTLLVAGVTAAAVLGVGVVLTQPDDQPPAATASGAPAAGSPALDPLAVVSRDLEQAPTEAGAGGADLLQRLRRVQSSTGAERTFAAASVLEAVRAGRERGSLQGPLVDAAERASAPAARPADLAALIAMVQVDPAAFGPRTPKFLGRLQSLQTARSGEAARTEAQDLWQIVQAGPGKGEFTGTFAALAVPVLRPLAVPADLAALVEAVRVEPARFGPRTPKFLGRLQKLTTLGGEARTVEARDLLQIVRAGVGRREFTPAFRDIAVPVLRPLAEA